MSKELDYQRAWREQQADKGSPALSTGKSAGESKPVEHIFPGTMPKEHWVAADSLLHKDI